MIKGFVFGKFFPFHKGHEAMIRFAITKCDFLTILVCCSDKENISGSIRQKWIEQTFQDRQNIEVRTYHYFEHELPNTSESKKNISLLWATVFKGLLPDYTTLITSEPYGDMVAEFMNIQHVAFDIDKSKIPVSSTLIRKDLFPNWKFLPESVRPYFAIKVVILGTESTGKTTLTGKLSNYYDCSFVLEAARDIIPDSNSFDFKDLHLVAQEHAKRIDDAVLDKSPLVIIDTDIHITKSYAQFIYKQELEVSIDIYNSNRANLYLYLNHDVQFSQDGTRLSETERNLLDLSHRQILKDHNVNFVEIEGSWEMRFEKAVEYIDRLIKMNNK